MIPDNNRILIFPIGATVLVLFWFFGYDGITFSDDIYYIITGHAFWNGDEVIDSYHFSSRLGSYIFSGIFTRIFGIHDRIASLPSLIAYLFSLYFIIRSLSDRKQQLWAGIFYISHVYLIHFIAKVYPDSVLVLWVILIPFAALKRSKYPIRSAFIIVASLLMGFMTKETIIYLFPFSALLFLWDKKQGNPLKHYTYLALFSIVLGCLYLGYYWFEFGDAFYRINSVNAGHYISEYSYNDKGGFAILKRLTITPFINLIERSYWLWMILAIPGLYLGLVKKEKVALEFSLAFLCLLLGFWFMTTNLGFYNPIYLNPRHLIILIPVLSVLIGYGYKYWLENIKWSRYLGIGVLTGAMIGFMIGDYKNAAFLLIFSLVLMFIKREILWLKKTVICSMLFVSVIYSFAYQRQLKNYPHFLGKLNETIEAKDQEILVVNNFVHFSREVLLPNDNVNQQKLFAIEDIQEFEQLAPKSFRLFIYNYFKHANPKEIPNVDEFLILVEKMGYEIVEKEEDKWVVIYKFNKEKE